MTTQPEWYAVYTRPKWEKKVAELLRRRKIEAYCPLNKLSRQWHDRKKILEEPLFSSYVFVCITKEEKAMVRKTEGVVNFVHWLGEPAIIRAEEIVAIKEFLISYKAIKLEKTVVKPNNPLQIQQCSLTNRQGWLLETFNKTVKIELPSLGYNLIAEVEKTNVEVITLNQQPIRTISVA